MIHVKLSELKPEMVLAADVMTADGRLLLEKGTSLTELYIRKLSALQVGSVFINEDLESKQSSDPVTTQSLFEEEARALIQKRFTGLSKNAVLEGLMSLGQKHLVEMLLGKSR